MVNRGIQALVTARFGDEMWQTIKADAGFTDPDFVAMHQYPDELTGRLVAAASARLGLPAETLLETFGEYWVIYTAESNYGDLMRLAGSTFTGFLQNLDALHARVGLSFPDLKPPSFRCEDITPTSVTLHYYSTRRGLTPLVVGLIKGLARRFDTDVRITPVRTTDAGADHDVFHIDYEPR